LSEQDGPPGVDPAEERYRSLFEHNPQAMWVYDPATLGFLEANQAAARCYGYTRDELLRMRVTDIQPAEAVSALPEQAVRPGAPYRTAGLCRHRKKDGTLLEVEVTSQEIAFEGRPARLVLANEVAERVQAEAALRRSERQLRAAQALAHVGSGEWDLASNTMSWSDELSRLFGLAPGDAPADDAVFLELIHPEDRALVQAAMRRGLRERRRVTCDYRILRPDGVTRRLSASAEMVVDEQGRPLRILGTAQDVTEARELEEQLRQAQKMEAVGRLACGVAHDFNNLLTAILGYADLLAKRLPGGRPGDTCRRDLEEIRKAASRATSLTAQLLAFSRKQVLAPQALDLNLVVSELERMLRRLIGEDIDLVTDLTPHLPPVKVDPGQLEQVLLNLAVNARHAMPEGGRLTVATRREQRAVPLPHHPPSGRGVVLEVTDTGCGMDAPTQARIFEPFFTTKPPGHGTGLGLATVYGIVEQSGGRIEVESQPGRGACFRIFLPCAENPAAAKPPASAPGPATPGVETILLLEDDDSVRELAQEVLESGGYAVLPAASGEDALTLCRNHPGAIDLLLADVVMPGGNGPRWATRLRSVRPGLQVAFMSGYTEHAALREAPPDALQRLLQKPFTPDRLLQAVREALDPRLR
jgi:PAS domain S-box-containing protein